MSRWQVQFESHSFNVSWKSLGNTLSSTEVSDKTVITVVEELARLKKAYIYLDSLLASMDFDLVPMNIWDGCYQQSEPCRQNIESYNAQRTEVYLQRANTNMDNLLSYIRPFMTVPKGAVAAEKKGWSSYTKQLEEYVHQFQERTTRSIAQIETAERLITEIEESVISRQKHITEVELELVGESGNGGIREVIHSLSEQANEKINDINQIYNELLVGINGTPSTKKEITDAYNLSLQKSKELSMLLDDSKEKIKQLTDFYTKIYGIKDEEEKIHGGLDNEIAGIKEKYETLVEEIEKLIPGATSASLATAYNDLKKEINPQIQTYTFIFYGAVIALFSIGLFFVVNHIGFDKDFGFIIDFIETNDPIQLLINLTFKLPLVAPVIWLALFASKRRSEAQRLQQEYAHKEAIAKSYIGFKTQIDALGLEEKDLTRRLLESAIDAISYNASKTLDGKHSDSTPLKEVLDAIAKLMPSKGEN
jgi:gas vesicle protein